MLRERKNPVAFAIPVKEPVNEWLDMRGIGDQCEESIMALTNLVEEYIGIDYDQWSDGDNLYVRIHPHSLPISHHKLATELYKPSHQNPPLPFKSAVCIATPRFISYYFLGIFLL